MQKQELDKEGELKKRIKCVYFLDKNLVEKWVDEAKEEFPLNLSKQHLGGTIEQYHESLIKLVEVERNVRHLKDTQAMRDLAMLEWFLKWYGEKR